MSARAEKSLALEREARALVRESRRRCFEVAEKARTLGPRVIAACARGLLEEPPPDSAGLASVMLLRLLLVEASQAVVREIEEEIDNTHSSLRQLVDARMARGHLTAPKLPLPDEVASFGRVVEASFWLSLPFLRERSLLAALEARIGREVRVAFMMFGYRLAAWFDGEHDVLDHQLTEKTEAGRP